MENISTLIPTDDPNNIGGYYVARLIIHIIIFLLGVPGNCLILRVYWTKIRKTSTHVLIMTLAWADLAACLLRVPDICFTALRLVGDQIDWAEYILCVQEAAIISSFVIMAVIAMDRYDCICRPQRRVFTHRRAKMAAVAAVMFALTINIFKYAVQWSLGWYLVGLIIDMVSFMTALVTIGLCYGGVYVAIRKHVKVAAISGASSGDEVRLRPNDKSRPIAAKSDHSTHGKLVLLSFSQPSESRIGKDNRDIIPMTSQSFSDSPQTNPGRKCEYKPHLEPVKRNGTSTKTDLPSAASSDRNPRPEAGNGPGRAPQGFGGAALQRKTTRMLFITSVVFLLTWLPFLIGAPLWFALGSESTGSLFYKIIYDLRVCVLINNVVNPLIYGLANRRFRKDCREVLGKMKLC